VAAKLRIEERELEAGGSNLATLRLALRVDASNPSSGA
jgi:hypothetical protein